MVNIVTCCFAIPIYRQSESYKRPSACNKDLHAKHSCCLPSSMCSMAVSLPTLLFARVRCIARVQLPTALWRMARPAVLRSSADNHATLNDDRFTSRYFSANSQGQASSDAESVPRDSIIFQRLVTLAKWNIDAATAAKSFDFSTESTAKRFVAQCK
jgi:hypothetical protein